MIFPFQARKAPIAVSFFPLPCGRVLFPVHKVGSSQSKSNRNIYNDNQATTEQPAKKTLSFMPAFPLPAGRVL